MNEISRSPNLAERGKPWAREDLLFLKDSLERGMSLVEIAGFLAYAQAQRDYFQDCIAKVPD